MKRRCCRRDPPLPLDRAGSKPDAPLDDKRRDPVWSRFFFFSWSRPGEDEEVVGHVGERDPHLLAVQNVVVALAHRGRLDPDRVGAGVRLGQPKGAELLALGQGTRYFCFCSSLPQIKAAASRGRYGRKGSRAAGVAVFEFFAGEPEAT